MLAYIIRRLLWLLPTVLGVTILVFLSMHLAPGDPIKIMLGPHATQAAIERITRELGLDQPLYKQYGAWLWNIFHGNWGRSIQLKREILPLVLQRFSNTALLAIAGILLACIVGISAGIIATFRRFTLSEKLITLLAVLLFSIPVFWLGLLLQIIFALKLSWFPVSGMAPATESGFTAQIPYLILPSVALAAEPAAVIARMTRSSMLEVMQEDYIRSARAKGLAEVVVTLKHGLRNAFIPVLTVIGMQLGFILAGAVFVEVIFSWPGIGLLTLRAILARDFPLVQGTILVVATSYVLINLIIDILYAYIKPSIKYD
jgi:peptide/nickel transport system permease protein